MRRQGRAPAAEDKTAFRKWVLMICRLCKFWGVFRKGGEIFADFANRSAAFAYFAKISLPKGLLLQNLQKIIVVKRK